MTHSKARPPRQRTRRPCARSVAVNALVPAVEAFPDLDPVTVDTDGLAPRDASLAKAIVGYVLRRWLTLEGMLNEAMPRPLNTQRPFVQAVLLTGAAQLVHMDRVPARAVVHEAVDLVKHRSNPKVAGFVNAVLRRVSLSAKHQSTYTITTAHKHMWKDQAQMQRLGSLYSCPHALLRRWVRRYGLNTALQIAHYGTVIPPVMIAVEPGFKSDDHVHSLGEYGSGLQYGYWVGSAGSLAPWLAENSCRRVQDPTAARAVAATSTLTPRTVLDLCAGRGTKTKQLVSTHPQATVIATDTSADRLSDLAAVAEANTRIQSCVPHDLPLHIPSDGVDLVVLDVPCSNTGVIARRPEARYRLNASGLRDIVALQRRIIGRGMSFVSGDGHVLYSTCSLEPVENQRQVRWICRRYDVLLICEHTILPSCLAATTSQTTMGYRDGGYYALLKIDKG